MASLFQDNQFFNLTFICSALTQIGDKSYIDRVYLYVSAR